MDSKSLTIRFEKIFSSSSYPDASELQSLQGFQKNKAHFLVVVSLIIALNENSIRCGNLCYVIYVMCALKVNLISNVAVWECGDQF